MFCAYCGESINNGSKFCCYCGEQTFFGNPSIKYQPFSANVESMDEFYKGIYKEIEFGDKCFKISKEQDCFNYYKLRYRENAASCIPGFISCYLNELSNVVDILEYTNTFVYGFYHPSFQVMAYLLEDAGLLNVEAEKLSEIYFNSEKLLYRDDLNILCDKYNAILGRKYNIANAVANVLPSGVITGSIEGYIAATALSIGASKVINSTLSSTEINVLDQNRLYEDFDLEMFFDHIYTDFKNLVYYFFKILNNAGVTNSVPEIFMKKNRAEMLVNSTRGKTLTKREWIDLYYDVFSCNPYEESYYQRYKNIIEHFNDKTLKEQFNRMVKYYCIDNVELFDEV